MAGVVKNITDYGAFVDLGGIDGLLHVTDMSWGPRAAPVRAVEGQGRSRRHSPEVRSRDRACLTRIQTAARRSVVVRAGALSSWATRLWEGRQLDRLPARFIELEPGVEGLIHVSEMSWSKRVKHPSKIMTVGDTVEAMVLGVDPEARRISLGLKQIEANPWQELSVKYPIGSRLTGSSAQPDGVWRLCRGPQRASTV